MAIEVHNITVIADMTEEVLKRKLDAFDAAVQVEATRIVVRTQTGKDVEGQAFRPYSKAYAKKKQKSGRKIVPPDLTFTGNMLTAIQTNTIRSENRAVATIYFSSPREAAKASGNQRLRRFFGLAREQVERILKKMNEA